MVFAASPVIKTFKLLLELSAETALVEALRVSIRVSVL
jgi:hypothetical protein